MVEDLFSSCLKTLGIPESMPYESLSFSEKALFMVCHKISSGQDFDFDELNTVLDDENKKKVAELLIKYYNV